MPVPCPTELRERAVWLTLEARKDPATRDDAITRTAKQLDLFPEMLRKWVRQAEINADDRPGTTTDDAARITELERENRELRRANQVLKLSAAFFATEFDRPSRSTIAPDTSNSTSSESNRSSTRGQTRPHKSLSRPTMQRRNDHLRTVTCATVTSVNRSSVFMRRTTASMGSGRSMPRPGTRANVWLSRGAQAHAVARIAWYLSGERPENHKANPGDRDPT